MNKCLISDLNGFSLAFIPMTNEPNAFILVSAVKESGGFDWIYYVGIDYSTNIQIGTGEHKIDFLDLLNVNSLAPSTYALMNGLYTSTATLSILSNETVSYVSSEPRLVSPPGQLRGWYIQYPSSSPVKLLAYFTFADDGTPVDKLSFTFSGLVIPEFNELTLISALIITTIITVIIGKRKIHN